MAQAASEAAAASAAQAVQAVGVAAVERMTVGETLRVARADVVVLEWTAPREVRAALVTRARVVLSVRVASAARLLRAAVWAEPVVWDWTEACGAPAVRRRVLLLAER